MGRKKGDLNKTTVKKIQASNNIEEFFKEKNFDALKEMYLIYTRTEDNNMKLNCLKEIAKYTHLTKDKQQDSSDSWEMFLQSLANQE